MTPNWLIRLNDFLAWINPVLALIAALLAAMVIAAAAERMPARSSKPAVAAAQVSSQRTQPSCPQAVLPPEWRELSRYD